MMHEQTQNTHMWTQTEGVSKGISCFLLVNGVFRQAVSLGKHGLFVCPDERVKKGFCKALPVSITVLREIAQQILYIQSLTLLIAQLSAEVGFWMHDTPQRLKHPPGFALVARSFQNVLEDWNLLGRRKWPVTTILLNFLEILYSSQIPLWRRQCSCFLMVWCLVKQVWTRFV